ncbi:unnamed protein product [Merluccius merluccius]
MKQHRWMPNLKFNPKILRQPIKSLGGHGAFQKLLLPQRPMGRSVFLLSPFRLQNRVGDVFKHQHLKDDLQAKRRIGGFSPSAASRRSSRASHRCFAPHSPMDLQLGHRVRIMLPSGRISTGTVRYLGFLQGEPELCLGVELASPDHATRQDGTHRGQSYFQCNPGYGVFVPFSKLLMAWE